MSPVETVRTEKFEDYKANRAPMPEELRGQIPQIRQALEAHRIPILEMENYEADDVLGSLARKGAAEGYDVILVSADKDLMQLVDEHVFLMHTGRNKLYDPAGVEEDFGVPPSQVVEVLALKGDSVDNVPGVPGIGEKGAIQLVRDHGTVENLLERADEIKRKSYREGLQQNHELALLSKELVTIHTDLPLDFEPDELRHEEPDTEALKELFRELEFFSLVDELEVGGPAEDIPAATAIALSRAMESARRVVGRGRSRWRSSAIHRWAWPRQPMRRIRSSRTSLSRESGRRCSNPLTAGFRMKAGSSLATTSRRSCVSSALSRRSGPRFWTRCSSPMCCGPPRGHILWKRSLSNGWVRRSRVPRRSG